MRLKMQLIKMVAPGDKIFHSFILSSKNQEWPETQKNGVNNFSEKTCFLPREEQIGSSFQIAS